MFALLAPYISIGNGNMTWPKMLSYLGGASLRHDTLGMGVGSRIASGGEMPHDREGAAVVEFAHGFENEANILCSRAMVVILSTAVDRPLEV